MKIKSIGFPFPTIGKLLLVTMKIYIFLFCVLTFGLSTEKGFSQNTKILFASDTELSIEEVFETIKKQTEHTFIYKSNLFENAPKVKVKKGKIKIEDLLGKCREIAQFDFRLTDNGTIYIQEIPQSVAERVQQSVSGTVQDQNGAPLPGANVVEMGTTNGVTADFDGNFTLQVADENAVLIVSYIGFATKEVPTNGQTTVSVTLEESAAGLDEVVVVGYGTQSKRKVTGAITSVKAASIENSTTAQVDALLQGRAPGVQVVQSSGAPGAEVFVRVRGSGSLLGESRPLYVIDGVPMNNISSSFLGSNGQRPSALGDINPNDIESMEILKDAAATAIYGARGSNGVVLITTKSGKDGKARFNFDAFTGLQNISERFDLLNGQQFVNLLEDERLNRDQPVFPEIQVTGINTDWQDEIFRPALIQNYNLSVSGGNERLKSFLSVGYFNQEGTIIGQEFERLNTRVNLDYQATDKIKVGTSTVISNTNREVINNDFSNYSVLGNALLRNPNLPVYNPDGTYNIDPLLSSENPVQVANEITNTSVQKRAISNLYAEWEIIEGLKLKTTFGFDYLDIKEQRFIPSSIIGQSGVADASALRYEELTWQNENTLTYSKDFGSHSLSALLGLSYLESEQNRLQAGGSSAGSDLIETVAIAIPSIPQNVISAWGLESYFGRVDYSYDDKYLLNGSIRADGSSRFGSDNRFGIFPAVSAGWRVSAEPFMENLEAVYDLKLRASYGVTGNQDGLPNFASLALYGTGNNYDGVPGIAQSQLPNEDLGWESTQQVNLGLDLALYNGRINFNADVYLKTTNDLIFIQQLPQTSGFDQIDRVNLGDLENRGVDLGISTLNFDSDFRWSTDFNISFNRNEITFLPENGALGSDFVYKLPDAFGTEGPYSIYRVGESVGSFYGYNFQGVYASDSDVPQEFFDLGVRAGDVIYEDIDGDGTYSRDNDRKIIGNALPKHTGGITNTFGYKGLELSIFMNWSYGNDIYNVTRGVLTAMSEEFNQSAETLDRWMQQGDVTDVPKALYGSSSVSGAANTDASSRYIEDGSFLRVKNVNLSYQFPANVSSRLGLNSLRCYISGQNLFTFTNYSGLDPENQTFTGGGGGVPVLGADYITQPLSRIYTVGVNLSF